MGVAGVVVTGAADGVSVSSRATIVGVDPVSTRIKNKPWIASP
jgi:hypothetical protein